MIRYLDDTNTKKYDEFVSSHPNGCFTQSSFWGRVKTEWKNIVFYSEDENRNIKGAMSILIRKLPIPFFNIRLAYCPKGPCVDFNDLETFHELMSEAVSVAKSNGACVLKMDPDLPSSPELLKAAEAEGLKITSLGNAYENMQPKFNRKVDLSGVSEEALMAFLPTKTRNAVRFALKNNVTVREAGSDEIDEYCRIAHETGERKKIFTRNKDYYLRMLKVIPKENIRLIFAEYEGELIAGGIFIIYGSKMTYSYGATSDRHRKMSGSVLLQYHIISEAVKRGVTLYDMGGIDGSDPNDSMDTFKKKFGGKVIENIGELDFILKPFGYNIIQRVIPFAKKVRKKIFTLIKHR